MAIKAGRVGVNPKCVDPIDGTILTEGGGSGLKIANGIFKLESDLTYPLSAVINGDTREIEKNGEYDYENPIFHIESDVNDFDCINIETIEGDTPLYIDLGISSYHIQGALPLVINKDGVGRLVIVGFNSGYGEYKEIHFTIRIIKRTDIENAYTIYAYKYEGNYPLKGEFTPIYE